MGLYSVDLIQTHDPEINQDRVDQDTAPVLSVCHYSLP